MLFGMHALTCIPHNFGPTTPSGYHSPCDDRCCLVIQFNLVISMYNCQICIYIHTQTRVRFQNKCYTYPGLFYSLITWCIAICIRLLFINNLMHTYGIFVVLYVCVWICMLCYAYLNLRVLSFVRVERYAYALNFFNFWCFGGPKYTCWTLNDRNVSFCGCCVIVAFHSPCSDELWWSLVC
jgi:hypothetical protein